MPTESKATARPWRVTDYASDTAIRGPQGLDGYGELVAVMGEQSTVANARLIVRSVNEREEVKALLVALLFAKRPDGAHVDLGIAWQEASALLARMGSD